MIIKKGKHKDYRWVQLDSDLIDLLDIILVYHANMRLHITAFDSGPISPNEEEKKEGWVKSQHCMISPRLSEDINIPFDQFDEWLIVDKITVIPEPERFVNIGSFTLVDPQQLEAESDQTWEKDGYHWLYPIQRRFWTFIENVNPVSYIANGDNLIVASRDIEFINELKENA